MTQMSMPSMSKNQDRFWLERLPLYAGSLVVTLAGIGAVGVTITASNWTLVWGLLTVIGHAVSLLLRRSRVAPEHVFFPVMVLGCPLALQQLLAGTPLSGLDAGLTSMTTDMATAVTVAALAVVRCFTLVSDTSLLFSPVPAITMLALVGSTNPNAEVPLFFGLVILGSLFISGYEAHLRRGVRAPRSAKLVTYYLLAAWVTTLAVALAALAAPMVVQPVISQFSPYALPAVGRLKGMLNFTQANQSLAPVGQGPIALSPNPMYEVYSAQGGRLRTSVYATYTGREWTSERQPDRVGMQSVEPVMIEPEPRSGVDYPNNGFLFRFGKDPDLSPSVPTRRVLQRIVTKAQVPPLLPALGNVRELHFPRRTVLVSASGSVSSEMPIGPETVFEVISDVPDYAPEQLRQAPRVDPEQFPESEMLQLPQSSLEVQELSQRITAHLPTAYDQIQAIIGYIEKNCRYSLVEDVTPQGEDAAAHYLFNSKRGACDLAATASAVMCRSIGIPARVAVGYVADEVLPQGGGFLVRQEHSHMWLEAYFAGYGWVPFDPAPPLASIRSNPLDMAWYRLHEVLAKIGGGGLDAVLLLLVVAATLALVAYVVATSWRPRRALGPALATRPGAATLAVYQRALELLARRGWRREPWMTAEEYLRATTAAWPDQTEASAALTAITALFQQAYYAENETPESVQAAERNFTRLKAAAPQRPREPRAKATTSTKPAPEAA